MDRHVRELRSWPIQIYINMKYLEVLVDQHPNGTKNGGEQRHDHLNLQDQGVRNRLLGLLVDQLHQRQYEAVQHSSSQSHDEAQHVLLVRLALGSVTARVQGQHGPSHAQQNDGVYGVGRELLLDQQESEPRREGELGGDKQSRGGDREARHAIGVDVVVEPGEEADDSRHEEQVRLHPEEPRSRRRRFSPAPEEGDG